MDLWVAQDPYRATAIGRQPSPARCGSPARRRRWFLMGRRSASRTVPCRAGSGAHALHRRHRRDGRPSRTRGPGIRSAIWAVVAQLRFPPPYSPDFDHEEMSLSKPRPSCAPRPSEPSRGFGKPSARLSRSSRRPSAATTSEPQDTMRTDRKTLRDLTRYVVDVPLRVETRDPYSCARSRNSAYGTRGTRPTARRSLRQHRLCSGLPEHPLQRFVDRIGVARLVEPAW